MSYGTAIKQRWGTYEDIFWNSCNCGSDERCDREVDLIKASHVILIEICLKFKKYFEIGKIKWYYILKIEQEWLDSVVWINDNNFGITEEPVAKKLRNVISEELQIVKREKPLKFKWENRLF